MAKAIKMKQLTLIVPYWVACSGSDHLFGKREINIESLCAYGRGEEGVFMIVTDNNAKAKKILTEMGAEVKTEEVIAGGGGQQTGPAAEGGQEVSEPTSTSTTST